MSKAATTFRPQHRPGELNPIELIDTIVIKIVYYQYASKTTLVSFLATSLPPIDGASRHQIATSTEDTADKGI
jgi:hypothetical protein